MPRRAGLTKLEVVVLLGVFLLIAACLLPSLEMSRAKARQLQSKNNLKQWGLAIHNYEDVYRCLPPGGWVLADGTERFGCVTALLPYYDSSPIYNDFDLNQGWNHPRNQPICRTPLPVCQIPGATPTDTSEGYGLCHYAVNPNVMHSNSSIRFDQITNGLGNTLLVGEAAGEYRPWGCPWNWRTIGTRLNDGPGSYGSPVFASTQFALVDGQVRAFNNDVDPQVLAQLATSGVTPADSDIGRPPIPERYPSTKIHHRWTPHAKNENWTPPQDDESPQLPH